MPLRPNAEQRLEGGGVARYERPAARLRDFITGYHFYSAPRGQARVDWFLPGSANIRVSWFNKPIAVTIGDRCYDPLPQTALFGPTSHALHARTRGGFMAGIGISPLGWARLFPQSADSVADRIVPLDAMWHADDAHALTALVQRHDVADPIAPLLDRFLQPRLLAEHREEALIARLGTLILQDDITTVGAIAAAMGVDETRLRRLAYRYFGFSPKQLIRRTKFLRSIVAMTERGAEPTRTMIDESYFDHSHFIREAHRFLGMTPRQFVDLTKPFLTASLDIRPKVLGAATQALQPVEHRGPDADDPDVP